jgi:hypothetical protein
MLNNNKLLNSITIISICLALIKGNNFQDEYKYYELPKFGEIEVYGQSWIYLNLKDFKQGDNIYFEYIFSSITFYYNHVPLLLSETNDYKNTIKSNNIFINQTRCFQDKIDMVVDHSCVYEYKLRGNYKYLIIITPKFEYYFTHLIEPQRFKHNKKLYGDDTIIYIILGVVLFIVIILVILYFFWLRKVSKKRENNIGLIIKKEEMDENI